MNIPLLELTEVPNKNNDFIIYRHSLKAKKINKPNLLQKNILFRRVREK